MDVKDKSITLDYFLTNKNDGLGLFQIMTILLVSVPSIFNGFLAGDFVFTAARLPHRCFVPECDDTTESTQKFAPDWIHNAIPKTDSGGIHDCVRYMPINYTNIIEQEYCPASLFDKRRTIECESYVYERKNSAVYDFNLECNEWLRTMTNLFTTLGSIVGLPFTSYVSDRWGRKLVVLLGIFFLGFIAIIRAFSFNYPMYVAFQFFGTALGGGAFSSAYILGTETVSSKHRVITSAAISSSFAVGQAFLGIIAWAVPNWRTLILVLHAPAFLLLVYYWILPESIRWIITKQKHEQATSLLLNMANMNGKLVREEHLDAVIKRENTNCAISEGNLLSRVLSSSVMLRRCCTTPFWWISTTCVYYGLSINSVSLGGSSYLNFSVSAAVEIPGFWSSILLLDRIGRKKTVFSGFLLSSVCCFGFAFLPPNMSTISLTLYLIGKFAISSVFTSLYLYTSELYPTSDRHKFLAFSSTIGRIGTVVASFSPALMIYWSGIPTALFGTLALISAVLVLTQPETLGTKLPDTLAEAELLK